MKLFSKYNRINLLFTIAIFIIGSIAFSLLIHYVVNNQIDDDLVTEKDEILAYVKQYHNLPAIENIQDQYTTYKLINRSSEGKLRFYTQKRWNIQEHENETVRSIEWNMNVGNKLYLITVSESLDIMEDLIQSIIIITIALILLILVAGLLINRVVLKRLWQPFYRSMQTVQQFELSSATQIDLQKSSIEEFDLMNTTLQSALNKAQHDYQTLKEFTENASHELQTPLAIISSKLDVIIQSEELTEQQSEAISSAYKALKKLKKLNQSLLLLAKIENRQFAGQTDIDLQQLIVEKQKQFSEQWQNKNLDIQNNTMPTVLPGNKELVDILLNNLFANAIRHNITNGFILLKLHSNLFQISNSGAPHSLHEQYIFNRFYKGKSESGQHGLGLSIVKQICDVSRFTCRYQFQQPNIHSFIISW